jgi:DNA gyrase subunit A
MGVFDLSQIQADYILDLQLGRLTKFSRLELEKEAEQLRALIAELDAILADNALLRSVVSSELEEVARNFGTPRRTVLLESAGQAVTAAAPLEVADDPCWVLLSATGLLARTGDDAPLGAVGSRSKHDTIVAAARATARGQIGLVTSGGRVHRLNVVEIPAIPPTSSAPHLQGGVPLRELLHLDDRPLTLMPFSDDGPGIALGTKQGVVKRVKPDHLSNRDSWELIGLGDGDEVIGAAVLESGNEQLVFITSDAQLLRFDASAVRPQGRAGGGIAGVRLAEGSSAVAFGAVRTVDDAAIVTIAGSSSALPGTQNGSAKVSPLAIYPAKGRATGGVRCQRLLKGEDAVILAWVGDGTPLACATSGSPVDLPESTDRRDASGTTVSQPVLAISGPPSELPGTR